VDGEGDGYEHECCDQTSHGPLQDRTEPGVSG
jgi:hypothetical protein